MAASMFAAMQSVCHQVPLVKIPSSVCVIALIWMIVGTSFMIASFSFLLKSSELVHSCCVTNLQTAFAPSMSLISWNWSKVEYSGFAKSSIPFPQSIMTMRILLSGSWVRQSSSHAVPLCTSCSHWAMSSIVGCMKALSASLGKLSKFSSIHCSDCSCSSFWSASSHVM